MQKREISGNTTYHTRQRLLKASDIKVAENILENCKAGILKSLFKYKYFTNTKTRIYYNFNILMLVGKRSMIFSTFTSLSSFQWEN